MAKFQTVITHKPESRIDIFGFKIDLKPDADGYCEFEVPDDRTDVIDRLNQIPEGFVQVGAAKFVPKTPTAGSVITVDGEEVDVSKLDKDNLAALGKHLGLNLHPNTGIDKLRASIIEEATKA